VTRIFISYNRQDGADKAEYLYRLLSPVHIVFYDKEILPAGSNWWNEIELEIETCSHLIFLISPRSLESKYCMDELELALDHSKIILPILIAKDVELKPNLKHIQAIEWYDQYPEPRELRKLFTKLSEESIHARNSQVAVEADHRLLSILWKFISSQILAKFEFGLENRQIPLSLTENFGQYFYYRNLAESKFHNNILQNHFKELDEALAELRGLLWTCWYKHPPNNRQYLIPSYMYESLEQSESNAQIYLRSDKYFEDMLKFQQTVECFQNVRQKHSIVVTAILTYLPSFFPYEEK